MTAFALPRLRARHRRMRLPNPSDVVWLVAAVLMIVWSMHDVLRGKMVVLNVSVIMIWSGVFSSSLRKITHTDPAVTTGTKRLVFSGMIVGLIDAIIETPIIAAVMLLLACIMIVLVGRRR